MAQTIGGGDPFGASWADACADPSAEAASMLSLEQLLAAGGPIQGTRLPTPRGGRAVGETPVLGVGAVARWLALHDRAAALRAGVASGDVCAAFQARRAIRSLFLYEHQLTGRTRRQARTALWRRDRAARPLPPFAERARWAACRCPRCQAERPMQLPTARPPLALSRPA